MSGKHDIRVAVIFAPGKRLKPVWFELRGEKYTIKEECYYWESTLGKANIQNFSVITDRGLLEIAYNTLDQSWQVIEKTED